LTIENQFLVFHRQSQILILSLPNQNDLSMPPDQQRHTPGFLIRARTQRFEKPVGLVARNLQRAPVANEVRVLQGRDTRLPRSNQLSWPTQFKINFCNAKSVISFAHYFQAPAHIGAIAPVAQKYARRLGKPTPDSSTKLMQLGQSEPFRVFDNHECCIGNINTNFDDSG
jgi:hypothetical protein